MEIILRKLIKPDFEDVFNCFDVLAKEKINFNYTDAPSGLMKYYDSVVQNNMPFLIVEIERQVVGWAEVSKEIMYGASHYGSLAIGLLPNKRKRGIGTKLLNAIIEEAKKYGFKYIKVDVLSKNRAAIALYEKLNFKSIGYLPERIKIDGAYHDVNLMVLKL